MPVTPNLGLPYPALAEVADVPTDMGELANALDVIQYPAARIADDAITTAKIADANVTTAKIADGAITLAKLAAALAAYLVPTGTIAPTVRTTNPTGWLLCDGATCTVALAPDLRQVLLTAGSPFGVVGADPKLPDLRGRTPVGRDGTTEFLNVGTNGGAKTHALTIAQMPSHDHPSGVLYGMTDAVAHVASGTAWGTMTGSQSVVAAQGGGGAHNNLQPYLAINWLVKT